MEECIIINDYIENDPLSENNLDKTLYLVNKTRLSTPQKSIWIYSGYTWNQIMNDKITDEFSKKRKQIISQCDILVDGRYVESKKDVTLKWRGSSNQNVINIQKSLLQKKVILWCD